MSLKYNFGSEAQLASLSHVSIIVVGVHTRYHTLGLLLATKICVLSQLREWISLSSGKISEHRAFQ